MCMVRVWDAFDEKNTNFIFWVPMIGKPGTDQFQPRKDPDLWGTKCEPVSRLVIWRAFNGSNIINSHPMGPNDISKINNHNGECFCATCIMRSDKPFKRAPYLDIPVQVAGSHSTDSTRFFLDPEAWYLSEYNLIWMPDTRDLTVELTGSHLVGSHLVADFIQYGTGRRLDTARH